ncbi:hypothetical protein E8L90_29695 [Brevibacillus antibioticus]|uniref:Uncharacterized protein n=1 Tax=Brevibacillus antibioticus TaxID=2570228 RepID=A0A4U2Y1L1_9BACL|nr:hypothetical protein [Brevibacillus antibioticus]TKI52931.1 hypothetical protein E8L90_29695 [Brevibacillus antibioticus]
MEKSVLYLILALLGVYVVFAELFTDKKPLSRLITKMGLPDLPNFSDVLTSKWKPTDGSHDPNKDNISWGT